MTFPGDGLRPRRDSLATRRMSGAVFATDALALALAASADAVLLLEAIGDGPIVTWSNSAARAFFGNPLEYRPSLLTLLSTNGDEVARRRLLTALDAATPAMLECPVIREDGTRWGEWSVSPLQEDEGAAPRWMVTVRDITDRRRRDQALEIYLRETEQARVDAQDQAQQAEALVNELTFARGEAQAVMQQRSAFLASVSHEIRTPLNGVIGLVGVLEGTPLAADQRDITRALRASAERLLALLNDVLDFAKMDSQRMQLESVEFDVHETIEQIVELLTTRPDATHLRVNTLIEPGVPNLLCGDPGRFGQVLSNLVGNAVKFTREGHVVVRASVDAMDDQQVILRCEVADTGIGIAPDTLDKLFEPFVQADAGTTRRYGGTGLGLAICKELVQLMGGSIGVRSSPGEGSVFWFTVRLAVSASAPLRGLPPLESVQTHRALLVDRDAENRAIFALQLGALGLPCDGVGTLAETLSRISARPGTYDTVFVHHDCPDAEPIEAARAIHDHAAGAPPTIILLAPLGASPPQAALEHAGVAGIIHTPVRQSTLAAQIDAAWHHAKPHTLPVGADMASEVPIAPVWLETPRILVAEDNIINQQVAQHMLQQLGCAVDVVANGLEALASLAQVPYDLVFMDCQMPECDGFEATRRLRANQFTAVPVVAMTANAMPGDRERCLDAGMNDYISKPVRFDEMDAVLRGFLADRIVAEITDPKTVRQSLTPPPSLAATPIRRVSTAAPQPPAAAALASAAPPAPSGDHAPMIDEKIVASLKGMQARGARKTLVADLLTVFRTQALEAGDLIKAAIDAGDVQRVREQAHKFKGACGSIGAALLAARAKDVEYAAREERLADAAVACRALSTLVPEALHALDAAYRDALG